MQKIQYYIADVFTQSPFGGNPLAVFLDADDLSTEVMQQIAREMNLSETVFVCQPSNTDAWAHLRIFTTEEELPFAGHPNVGTAAVLCAAGRYPKSDENNNFFKSYFEEKVGEVGMSVEVRADGVYSELKTAVPASLKEGVASKKDYAIILGLGEADFDTSIPTHVGNAGLDFGLVVLSNEDALNKAKMNIAKWEQGLKNTAAKFTYLVFIDQDKKEVQARMFCPSLGVPEDPATGSAAAALSGLLAKYFSISDSEQKWSVRQGEKIERPSIIQLRFESRGNNAYEIRVGGYSVVVAEGLFHLS